MGSLWFICASLYALAHAYIKKTLLHHQTLQRWQAVVPLRPLLYHFVAGILSLPEGRREDTQDKKMLSFPEVCSFTICMSWQCAHTQEAWRWGWDWNQATIHELHCSALNNVTRPNVHRFHNISDCRELTSYTHTHTQSLRPDWAIEWVPGQPGWPR